MATRITTFKKMCITLQCFKRLQKPEKNMELGELKRERLVDHVTSIKAYDPYKFHLKTGII